MSGVELLLVALGGAFGAVARALMDQAVARAGWLTEYGTLTINLVGSLFAGLLVTLIVERSMVPSELRPLLITGLLGGFTTFSSYAFQSVEMLMGGRAIPAVAYVVATNVAALLAVWVGLRITGGA
jgi:CrcB protein